MSSVAGVRRETTNLLATAQPSQALPSPFCVSGSAEPPIRDIGLAQDDGPLERVAVSTLAEGSEVFRAREGATKAINDRALAVCRLANARPYNEKV
jgi:hypothetical protein